MVAAAEALVWCCWCCHRLHSAQFHFHVVASGKMSSNQRSNHGSSCNRCCIGTSGPQQTCRHSRSGHSFLPVVVVLMLQVLDHLVAVARLLLQHPDLLEHQERPMHQVGCLGHQYFLQPGQLLEQSLVCPVAALALHRLACLQRHAVRPTTARLLRLLDVECLLSFLLL